MCMCVELDYCSVYIIHIRVDEHIHKYGSVQLYAHKSTLTLTHRQEGGRCNFTHQTDSKNLCSTQTPRPSKHTYASHFISHPPGCLRSRHPNPLKITFSYYPNNGSTECNFNSRSKNETGRNRTPHRSLTLLACSLLRGGEASKEDVGGEEEVREKERQAKRGKSSKRNRKVKFFFLKRENGPACVFCFFGGVLFLPFSSPTMRLAKC